MAKQILTLARSERGRGWSAKIWDDAEDRGQQATAPLQPQPEGGAVRHGCGVQSRRSFCFRSSVLASAT